jgi:lysozyme family protein
MEREMHSIESIAAEIVRREGGFVNDPDDPGGATNRGVTIGTMQRLGIDLTRDGKVDVADVRALSAEQAVDVYVRHYYREPKLNLLPAPLQPSVFDMQVNAGANAVRILQRLLAAFGLPLKDDGVIGPITARSVARAMNAAPDHLVDAYGIARRNYYYRLGDQRPASRKYARTRDGGKGGWILRAEEFVSERFRLTRAEHAARVAAWA